MISLTHVDVHHGRLAALLDVTFRLDPGTLTAVIGTNGSGKSTLFGVLSGRLHPSTGDVEVGGSVADVLQATAIDSQLRLTVEDVVRIGRYPALGLLRRLRPEDRRVIDEAVDRVGLSDLRRRPIGELSGGQRQRALVAQGLAQDSDILLLDEPSAGLDLHHQRVILQVAREEAERGRTVLFSTHQLDEVTHADTVIALQCRCLCCAPPASAMARDDVRQIFGPAPRFGVDGRSEGC